MVMTMIMVIMLMITMLIRLRVKIIMMIMVDYINGYRDYDYETDCVEFAVVCDILSLFTIWGVLYLL